MTNMILKLMDDGGAGSDERGITLIPSRKHIHFKREAILCRTHVSAAHI